MRTVGISIQVGRQKRFVGKVGLAPTYDLIPKLQGNAVFYRDVEYDKCVIKKANAMSVDVEATDKAHELGADYFVTYCPDKRTFYGVAMPHLMQSPVTDEGERSQYRVPLDEMFRVEDAPPLRMGWTNDVIHLEPEMPF